MDLSELRLFICGMCDKIRRVAMRKFFVLICMVSFLFCNTSYAKTQTFEMNNLSDAFSDKDAWEN